MPPDSVEAHVPKEKAVRGGCWPCPFPVAALKRAPEKRSVLPGLLKENHASCKAPNQFPEQRVRAYFDANPLAVRGIWIEDGVVDEPVRGKALIAGGGERGAVNLAPQARSHLVEHAEVWIAVERPDIAHLAREGALPAVQKIAVGPARRRKSRVERLRHFP